MNAEFEPIATIFTLLTTTPTHWNELDRQAARGAAQALPGARRVVGAGVLAAYHRC